MTDQTRPEPTSRRLPVSSAAMAAPESLLRDLDFAKEMTAFLCKRLLVQSSLAMAAQANVCPRALRRILA